MLESQRSSPEIPLFVADSGDALWKSDHIPAPNLPQQQLKGALIAKSLALGGIDAMTPGEGDLALGVDWYLHLVKTEGLPVISANLRCGGEAPFPATRVVDRGGVKLGFTAVIAPDLVPAGCEASDPTEAVKAAVTALGPVDVLVVLTHLGRNDDEPLAQAVPEIDLIVSGHNRVLNDSARALPGDALQLAGGSRGRQVGVATVQLIPGASGFEASTAVDDLKERLERAEKRLKDLDKRQAAASGPLAERLEAQRKNYEAEVTRLNVELDRAREAVKAPHHKLANSVVTLGTDVADEPRARALLDETKAAITALESQAAVEVAASGGREGSMFIGALSCQGCHPAEFNQWASTPHAMAWATLVSADRAMDRECFSCHATGVGDPGGPTAPNDVGDLANVQCEACHGPGRSHAAGPAKGQMLPAPPAHLCTKCHDGIKDEGRFDPEAYMPKVSHGDGKQASQAP